MYYSGASLKIPSTYNSSIGLYLFYSNRELLMDTGRMSMRSADITAAATWGGSTQVSEDEGLEDGYPSDGIIQVEEEEEQVSQRIGPVATQVRDARIQATLLRVHHVVRTHCRLTLNPLAPLCTLQPLTHSNKNIYRLHAILYGFRLKLAVHHTFLINTSPNSQRWLISNLWFIFSPWTKMSIIHCVWRGPIITVRRGKTRLFRTYFSPWTKA